MELINRTIPFFRRDKQPSDPLQTRLREIDKAIRQKMNRASRTEIVFGNHVEAKFLVEDWTSHTNERQEILGQIEKSSQTPNS